MDRLSSVEQSWLGVKELTDELQFLSKVTCVSFLTAHQYFISNWVSWSNLYLIQPDFIPAHELDYMRMLERVLEEKQAYGAHLDAQIDEARAECEKLLEGVTIKCDLAEAKADHARCFPNNK